MRPDDGAVTLLLTDVEGSTRMMEQDPVATRALLAEHDRIVARSTAAHGGRFVRDRSEGDSAFLVFDAPADAVRCAVDLQRELLELRPGRQVRVRMGLHAGRPHRRGEQLYGPVVNRCGAVRNLGHGGQVLLSAAVVDLLGPTADFAFRELGEHRLKGLNDRERVVQVLAEGLPVDFPPLRSPDEQRHNLPPRRGAYVGDSVVTGVLADARALRLVTLVGPGGIGKTRLALEVAHAAVGTFPDGVWLVDLAGHDDVDTAADTVATAIGVREQPGQSLAATVAAHVAARDLLLVLDGCTNATGALVTDLVRGPDVHVLATAHGGLGVAGEVVRPVRPLGVPAAGARPAVAAEAPAVRLFLDRLRSRGADPVDEDAVLDVVAGLCRRLDGIPLAIEVAAGRVAALPAVDVPAALAVQLAELGVAPTSDISSSPVDPAVMAALTSGHTELLPEEQALLRRASVFAGGFTLEAAEDVCSDDTLLPEEAVLDALAGLAGRSLLLVDDLLGGVRYRSLHSVLLFGRGLLAGAGEDVSFVERHRRHFADLIRTVGGEHLASDPAGLDALEADHDNVRRALAPVDGQPVDDQLWLAGLVAPLWLLRGHWTLGRRILEGLLAGPTVLYHPRSAAATSAARIATLQGDYDAAERWTESATTALGTLRETIVHDVPEDGADTADTDARLRTLDQEMLGLLLARGELAQLRGDLVQAVQIVGDALDRSRALGDESAVRHALNHLGVCEFNLGRLDAAHEHLSECVDLTRRTDHDPAASAMLLNTLGALEWYRGRFTEARSHYVESLELRRPLGDRAGIAQSTMNIADVELTLGRDGRAMCAESLALYRDLGYPVGIAEALRLSGELATAAGDFATARATLSEAASIMRELGDPCGVVSVDLRLARLARAASTDLAAASAALTAGLPALEAAGDRVLATLCHAELARLASVVGDVARARQLLGADGAAPSGIDAVDIELVDAAAEVLADEPPLAGRLAATAATWRTEHGVPGAPPTGAGEAYPTLVAAIAAARSAVGATSPAS